MPRGARRAVLGAILSGVVLAAGAQSYPSRPINMIVPLQAGSGVDAILRTVANKMAENMGQNIVIENQPGASGLIGAERLTKAAPDGYTIGGLNDGILTMLPNLNKELKFGIDDFTPIGNITGTSGLVAIRMTPQWGNIGEFVAWAKANPGKVNLGTAGAGTLTHILGAAMQARGGVKYTHIPYKGVADAVTAMLAGNVDIVLSLPAVVIPHVKTGKLRAIATFGNVRSEFLPEAPTFRESGIDFVDVARFGLFGPKGLPAPVLAKLASALEEAVKSPEFAALMQKGYTTVLYHAPAEYRTVLDDENRRWAALLNDPNFAEAMK